MEFGLGYSIEGRAAQVSHGAIQFMVYEELKRQLSTGSSPKEPRVLTALEITLVGAASKLFATLSTYPFSVGLPTAPTTAFAISSQSSCLECLTEMDTSLMPSTLEYNIGR